MKESESKEELYICDHADEDCKCKGKHFKPHRNEYACNTGTCIQKGIKVQCIPYKEPKEEPKTKEVAVIWFGELEDWMCHDKVEIRALSNTDWPPMDADELLGVVEPIDFDRIQDAISSDHVRHIAIKPTPPEPETVDLVMRRMPRAEDHKPNPGHFAGPIDYSKFWRKMMAWQKDLKEAQERIKS